MYSKWKGSIRRERCKLKEMAWRDRLWYVWEYYKATALLLIMAAAFLFAIGSMLYRQTFREELFCLVINGSGPDAGAAGSPDAPSVEGLAESFHQAMGYGRRQTVTVDASIQIDGDEPETAASYAYLAKLTALLSDRDLDVVIADPGTISRYQASGAWADLAQILPQDLLEAYQGTFVFATLEDGSRYPCALSLSGVPDVKKEGLLKDSPLFAVKSGSRHIGTSVEFLRFLSDPNHP